MKLRIHSVHSHNPSKSESSKIIDVSTFENTCDELIDYLNFRSGHKFQKKTVANRLLLGRLLSIGYCSNDIKLVIDFKVNEWLHSNTMKKYLRPSTLFAYHNFIPYHTEAINQRNEESI